ncbi:Uncharacterised protein [uncultured Clostridium sp.]|uniref:hypothetical protein n=1 Tax=uncultured Clostridium sp. TaxID=59620 RepID=UPI000820CB18|nr:hypothetical protein [uncultured Clostridium sp.]SCJ99843.1 Uncharacterised protein [uncultured Clostridium sp.]
MKRKFSEIHEEYNNYKNEEKDIKMLYETIKRDYLDNKNLNITLEKIYLKNCLEDYKGSTIENYISILIVVVTAIVTILVEKGISESSNYIFGIISVLIAAPLVFICLLKLDRKIIRKEIDKHIYYSICLDVIEELEGINNKDSCT